ncbi:varicose-related protein-like [Hibiscus syriacus]|uniref:alpha-1,2-Mannosidase n=1 Tax=Hibiscus syriacus TaxID=106335 RepID=A0A6A3CW32_HIBSY|nr:varicose-related protein-like [Hibiscus syriacus]
MVLHHLQSFYFISYFQNSFELVCDIQLSASVSNCIESNLLPQHAYVWLASLVGRLPLDATRSMWSIFENLPILAKGIDVLAKVPEPSSQPDKVDLDFGPLQTCESGSAQGITPLKAYLGSDIRIGNLGCFPKILYQTHTRKPNAPRENKIASIFETTIRILGGLVSAHLIASDYAMGMRIPSYDNQLLDLAKDMAMRLLPAFDTPTRIPFGSVNLKYGVDEHEIKAMPLLSPY